MPVIYLSLLCPCFAYIDIKEDMMPNYGNYGIDRWKNIQMDKFCQLTEKGKDRRKGREREKERERERAREWEREGERKTEREKEKD